MHKIMSLIVFLSLSAHAQGALELDSLLRIRPDSKLDQKIPLEGKTSRFEYSIELKSKLVESVRIDMNSPLSSTSLIQSEAKGYCLIQMPSGSAVLPLFYFFDVDKNHRYELTPSKEIKSILIQKIPEVRKNTPCAFKDFSPAKAFSPEIKKVK